MDDGNSLLPNDILSRIVTYTTLRIQRILSAGREQNCLSMKWKFSDTIKKVVRIKNNQLENVLLSTLNYSKLQNAKFVSFDFSHVFSAEGAYCAFSGRKIFDGGFEDNLTALNCSMRGFILGRGDGAISFPQSLTLSASRRFCHNQKVTVIHYSRDTVLTGSDDGECAQWTLDGRFEKLIFRHSCPITSISTFQDAAKLIGFANGEIAVFLGLQILMLKHSKYAPFALEMNADRFLFSGHEDGKVRIVNLKNQKNSKVIACGGVISSISVKSDLMAVGLANGCVELYNWITGEQVNCFRNHYAMVTKVLIHADEDRIFSSAMDGTLVIIQRLSGRA